MFVVQPYADIAGETCLKVLPEGTHLAVSLNTDAVRGCDSIHLLNDYLNI